jgi:hypothetical protein
MIDLTHGDKLMIVIGQELIDVVSWGLMIMKIMGIFAK